MSLTIKTASQIADDAKAAEQVRAADAARRYLADTDWMVIRAIETEKPIPQDVIEARALARKTVNETKQHITLLESAQTSQEVKDQ